MGDTVGGDPRDGQSAFGALGEGAVAPGEAEVVAGRGGGGQRDSDTNHRGSQYRRGEITGVELIREGGKRPSETIVVVMDAENLAVFASHHAVEQ